MASARHLPALRALIRAAGVAGLALLAALATAAPAAPDTAAWILDTDASVVAFAVPFAGHAITGTIPVRSAEIRLDPARPAASAIRVELDATGAEADIPFATAALRGPGVLDATRHPAAWFLGTDVRIDGHKGTVAGMVTIRGVDRPVTLRATLDAPPQDDGCLALRLTGALRRSEFGADGWSRLIGDTVALDLRIRMTPAQ